MFTRTAIARRPAAVARLGGTESVRRDGRRNERPRRHGNSGHRPERVVGHQQQAVPRERRCTGRGPAGTTAVRARSTATLASESRDVRAGCPRTTAPTPSTAAASASGQRRVRCRPCERPHCHSPRIARENARHRRSADVHAEDRAGTAWRPTVTSGERRQDAAADGFTIGRTKRPDAERQHQDLRDSCRASAIIAMVDRRCQQRDRPPFRQIEREEKYDGGRQRQRADGEIRLGQERAAANLLRPRGHGVRQAPATRRAAPHPRNRAAAARPPAACRCGSGG